MARRELSLAQHQVLDALLTLEQRNGASHNSRYTGIEVARELAWSTQRAGAILGATRRLGLTGRTPWKYPYFYLTPGGREEAKHWRLENQAPVQPDGTPDVFDRIEAARTPEERQIDNYVIQGDAAGPLMEEVSRRLDAFLADLPEGTEVERFEDSVVITLPGHKLPPAVEAVRPDLTGEEADQ